jgi:hypothetical protein
MTSDETSSEYLLLIRGTDWHQRLAPEEVHQNIARFTAWAERLRKEGKVKSARPLVHEGKIVIGRDTVTDGPFNESKEAIAGFFVILAQDFEEALQIARECPGLDYGQTLEVREIASEPGELKPAREKERTRAQQRA